MNYENLKNSLNDFLGRYAGAERRPVFHDIDQTLPELRSLELAFPRIRTEADNLLQWRIAMPRYHEVHPPAWRISNSTRGSWSVFLLDLLGYHSKRNQGLCPQTSTALQRIPGRLQSFFSILDPGKSVPIHGSPYLGYLRYHLGVNIPKDDPPLLRVRGREYVWKEGEGMIFDGTWPHEVVNRSRSPQVMLIVDILRPLPLIPDLINRALLWGLAAPFYAYKVMERVERYSRDLIERELFP